MKHYSKSSLKEFLENKKNLNSNDIAKVKGHLNNCMSCWSIWNTVRWDAARGSQGIAELREYLGDSFEEYYDSSWALAHEWNSQSRSSRDEIENFYKETSGYLYNSLIFFESGDREELAQDMNIILESQNIETVLDYGSGVGNDTLPFLAKGLTVYFADFDSPVSDFLKFRISKRGYEAKARFIDVQAKVRPNVDLIWTIDTLEHMVNPYQVLDYITNQTKVFAYFIDDDTSAGGRHPFHIEFDYDTFNAKLVEKGFSKLDSNKLSSWSKVWAR